ncbi:hypothetical protein I8H89_00275 [Candidatus Saccharibacteria bacterium]|nr:hypothetical protein [Candidatus Saccharibacteria bacterium]
MGMCLNYSQRAFGAGWAGSYALEGWNRNTQFNHQDSNMPSGVYILVWFTGYWDGFNYGHVVVYKDGVCWSSPYTKKNTHDRLPSIAEVERIYGMKFLGWSEGIGGTRVIKKKENSMAIIQNAENWYWRCNDTHLRILGRELSRAVFNSFVGQDFLKFVEACTANVAESAAVQNWQNVGRIAVTDNWQGQIHTLKAQVSEFSKRPTQAQLDAINKKAESLAGSVDAARKAAEEANAAALQRSEELAKNQIEIAQSKKEADNFITAVINSVRSMFGGSK